MANQVFREDVLDRLSSPEQINDYVHVTNPRVWVTLGAVVLLIVGSLIWASLTYVSSFLMGTASVRGGTMIVVLDEGQNTENLEVGMAVTVGDTKTTVTSIGTNNQGQIIAMAYTDLSDGKYDARISYKKTQLIRLLFN